MKFITQMLPMSLFCIFLMGVSGCVGTAIETVTDAAVAVAKVPFKVGGAVVDVVTDDDEDED
ncbi:MAG: hypothetical protein ACI909_002974 [Planctomycetota bacterium]|jgi:hypothetical protein